jgi:hypothetical protein
MESRKKSSAISFPAFGEFGIGESADPFPRLRPQGHDPRQLGPVRFGLRVRVDRWGAEGILEIWRDQSAPGSVGVAVGRKLYASQMTHEGRGHLAQP